MQAKEVSSIVVRRTAERLLAIRLFDHRRSVVSHNNTEDQIVSRRLVREGLGSRWCGVVFCAARKTYKRATEFQRLRHEVISFLLQILQYDNIIVDVFVFSHQRLILALYCILLLLASIITDQLIK